MVAARSVWLHLEYELICFINEWQSLKERTFEGLLNNQSWGTTDAFWINMFEFESYAVRWIYLSYMFSAKTYICFSFLSIQIRSLKLVCYLLNTWVLLSGTSAHQLPSEQPVREATHIIYYCQISKDQNLPWASYPLMARKWNSH